MKLNIVVENIGKICLTDKEYLASGGEAQVFVKDRIAYKIYHAPSKMIPVAKIQELQKITLQNVLKPDNIIRNNNTSIGYSMKYIKDAHPLCKLFTRSFRQANGIANEDITGLVKEIQSTIAAVHKEGFLIVDLNEMNILASSDFRIPYFIDVDSWQCNGFPATAIMESIRDRLIKNNKWTETSDWFSFAVIAFQLYIGAHPYKGSHPKYKPNEWSRRMDDGVSVFDPKVALPRVCNDFSVIPKSHLEWFKAVFIRNERSIPPFPDQVIIQIPFVDVTVESDRDFETKLIFKYPEEIRSVFNFMGVTYAVGQDRIYKENKDIGSGIKDYKVLLCESNDMSPVVCKLKDEELVFETISGGHIGRISALDMMYRNGAIYSVYSGRITENTFTKIGTKVMHVPRETCHALDQATKVFEGVIFQDLLGKPYISLPFALGKCIFIPVPELNGYRILEARSDQNICGVLAEKKGVYYRFLMVFDERFQSYTITRTDNVDYAPINFVVLPNQVCVYADNTEVRVFKGDKGRIIGNPPFTSDNKLFTHSGNVYFLDKNKVYSAKIKK
jgi:hypothetical protein